LQNLRFSLAPAPKKASNIKSIENFVTQMP
jgi:hypothetical protein